MIIFTDGSVQQGIKSQLRVEVITEALKWLGDNQHNQATFLTDSMSTLDKIHAGSLYGDWVKTIQDTNSIRRLQWIFCPGHAGVKGNERADKLAGSANIEGVLTLDSPTVIGLVRDHLASNRVEESFTKEMLTEKGVQQGEGRRCGLRDPVRRCNNQLMTETVSLHTLRWGPSRGEARKHGVPRLPKTSLWSQVNQVSHQQSVVPNPLLVPAKKRVIFGCENAAEGRFVEHSTKLSHMAVSSSKRDE